MHKLPIYLCLIYCLIPHILFNIYHVHAFAICYYVTFAMQKLYFILLLDIDTVNCVSTKEKNK